jgi:hypothetical protein
VEVEVEDGGDVDDKKRGREYLEVLAYPASTDESL